MAKRPPPGRCVHCLCAFDELTWDHVLPSGWYPNTTPANLEKWKIPSCLPCNALHAKSEGELLIRLGLCVDPDNPSNAGIVEKVLRALTHSAARDASDAEARERHRQEILMQALEGSAIPERGIYPGFGPHPGEGADEQVGVPISATALHRLTEKIVRGITYLHDGRLIEPPYQIEFYALDDDDAAPLREVLRRYGQEYQRGPGIAVRRAVPHDEPLSAVYEIEIWRKLKTYAFVGRERDEHAT